MPTVALRTNTLAWVVAWVGCSGGSPSHGVGDAPVESRASTDSISAPAHVEVTLSTEPAATPSPPPAPTPSAPVPGDEFVYREVLTGLYSNRTETTEWSVRFDEARHVVAIRSRSKASPFCSFQRSEPEGSNCSAAQSKSDGPAVAREWSGKFSDGDHAARRLALEGGVSVDCKRMTVEARSPKALIESFFDGVNQSWRSRWVPEQRRSFEVLACDRATLGPSVGWAEQPTALLLSAAPGLEFIHENSSDSVQTGTLRWLK
ncbi:MAG: hypothetical protein U0271_01020 [Polyangiaceae bacterium]